MSVKGHLRNYSVLQELCEHCRLTHCRMSHPSCLVSQAKRIAKRDGTKGARERAKTRLLRVVASVQGI